MKIKQILQWNTGSWILTITSFKMFLPNCKDFFIHFSGNFLNFQAIFLIFYIQLLWGTSDYLGLQTMAGTCVENRELMGGTESRNYLNVKMSHQNCGWEFWEARMGGSCRKEGGFMDFRGRWPNSVVSWLQITNFTLSHNDRRKWTVLSWNMTVICCIYLTI